MLIWQLSNGAAYGVIQALGQTNGEPYTLVNINPRLKEWALGEQQVIKWTNSRGEDLEGILIKPVGFQEGRRYPLIVDLYSGRTNGFMGTTILANQALASKGYAVFFPDHRAHHIWMNYMRDVAYSQVARGAQGGDIMIDDVLSGVNVLVKKGIVDPGRIGLYGYSNGATAVNYLVTKTPRFKCAVSAEGFADWTLSYFLETDVAYTSATLGQTPWADPQTYIKLSPIYHLDRITTPLLLAVGDKGTPARLLGYISMFNGLRRLKRDVILVRYPDQGHVFTGRALSDYWERVNAFFDSHLKPDYERTRQERKRN